MNPTTQLTFALIGAGRIGAIHARNLAARSDARLAWVADPSAAAAEALADGLPGSRPRACADPYQAIDDPSVDAVVIASPTPSHVEFILAAISKGKAVFCEKPVDLDLARARACADSVAARGGRVMIGFNRRFDPTFAQIQRQARAGAIGRLEQVVIVSRDPAPPGADYIATSGGIFRDMSIHDLDMARFLLGPINAVTAVGQNVAFPDIEAAGDVGGAMLTLRADSGAIATIVNSRRCAFGYDQRLEVFGAKGMLQARNQAPTSIVTTLADSTDAGARFQDFFLERYAQAYRAELDAFVDGLRSGRPLDPSLADGVSALELADAAALALAEGRTVTLGSGTP
ncbi:MAG: inositol 2-dehydrogenase [Bifidobacteriaceae bacterium]|jgi:myo-inositol 2-dehydrogenase/D-chiro-inositol 1-dehydrogenase|nr:inositol 2-dehydrogenase [Bifidobacteriaceae bacterium]